MTSLPLAGFAHVEQDGAAVGQGGRLPGRHGPVRLAEKVPEHRSHVAGRVRERAVQGQAHPRRALVLIIHGHDRMTGGVQEGRGDRGTVPGLAVHPDFACGHVGQARGQLMNRYVHGPGDV